MRILGISVSSSPIRLAWRPSSRCPSRMRIRLPAGFGDSLRVILGTHSDVPWDSRRSCRCGLVARLALRRLRGGLLRRRTAVRVDECAHSSVPNVATGCSAATSTASSRSAHSRMLNPLICASAASLDRYRPVVRCHGHGLSPPRSAAQEHGPEGEPRACPSHRPRHQLRPGSLSAAQESTGQSSLDR